MNRLSGLYEIRNTINGHRYIGSACNLRHRWMYHRRDLRAGDHHNPYLQRSWNIHGEPAFTNRTILFCKPDDLLMYEQIALDGLNPEYNCCVTAGSKRGYRSPRPMTLEHRQKISAANLGKKRPREMYTDEYRAKLSLALTGRVFTAEHRARIGEAHLGKKKKPFSTEALANISKASRLSWEKRRQRQRDAE